MNVIKFKVQRDSPSDVHVDMSFKENKILNVLIPKIEI